ncbi:SET domain-containing protein 5 [Seiridium cupressi]
MKTLVLLYSFAVVYPGLGSATATNPSSSLYADPLFQPLACEPINAHNKSAYLDNLDLTHGLTAPEDADKTFVTSSSWEVRPSPGKGLGVFATRLIKAGDRIMVEEPLFTITPPEFVPGRGYELSAMASSVDTAVSSLSPSQRTDFDACHAHHLPGEDENDRNMVIFRSNAYTLTDGTIAMFPRIARINHSCRPNAANIWSEASNSRVIWAARDITPGEEVTVTYAPLLKTSNERQRRLAQYGFRCSCEACREHEHTDGRRLRMGRLLAELEERLGRSTSEVANKKLLPKAVEMVHLMEEEHMMDYLPNAYRLVAELSLRSKDIPAAAGWSRKALQLHEFADEKSHAAESEREYLTIINS